MFGISRLQLAISLALGAVLLSSVGVAYWQFKRADSLGRDLAKAEGKLETERAANSQLRQIARDWEKAMSDFQVQLDRLGEVQREARQDGQRLRDIFREHDLSALAARKPGLVERRVNDGTARALRLHECATGGPCGGGPPPAGETAPTSP